MNPTRVLITGATGYIGRRLKNTLMHYPELQVCLFVRNVLKVQEKARQQVEIVELLTVFVSGVDFHRKKIRKKLGLTNEKSNLRSYLLSLQ